MINKLLKEIDAVLKENGVQEFKGEFTFKDTSMKIEYYKDKPHNVGKVTKTEVFRFDATSKHQKEL